ncbi:TPA: hypothetical protein ACX96Z_000162 [Clostridium sporogenes]
MKKLWKEHNKAVIAWSIIVGIIFVICICISLCPKENPVMIKNTDPEQTQYAKGQNEYVPISEGWKASKTAKGDITSAQKLKLDGFIESWKNGNMSDSDLKDNIMKYLDEQKIDYKEVSVSSKGYTLYDEIPKVSFRGGGNLYSFVGIYSTGKQNPNGTQKTVCYNWSAFVF